MINKEELKRNKDGSAKWTLTTKVPIRDETGKITEEKLLQSRYEMALLNRIAKILPKENETRK